MVGLRTRHRVPGQTIFGRRPHGGFLRRLCDGRFVAALRFGLEVRHIESVQAAQLDGYVFID